MELASSVVVADLIRARRGRLAARAVALQYERQPDAWSRYGAAGEAKSIRDAGYHLDYLAEALAAGDVGLFLHYATWLKELFFGLGFRDDAAASALECLRLALEEELLPEAAPLPLPYLDAALRRLASARDEPTSFLPADAPHAALACAYLGALLRADRAHAVRLVLDAVDEGLPLRDLYLWVFQPVQREVGRLWQTNRISVAQEHFCTAATQLVMGMLYPRLFAGERGAGRAVVTCVSGELHELGARMVADFLEMDGWDTYYVGANAPPEAVVEAVRQREARVLGISTTMTFHLPKVRELVRDVRAKAGRPCAIVVGGYPFNVSDSLWRSVGADGYAPDAEAASAVVRELATR